MIGFKSAMRSTSRGDVAAAVGYESTAHRVLQIPEIVGLIFSFMDAKDNANNACVCRRWSAIALDALWGDMDGGLNRLFDLLAPSMFVHEGWQTFSRALTPDDWARFSRYAGRVRRLRFDEGQKKELDEKPKYRLATFDEIARTRTMLNILPNLHTLEWRSPFSDRFRLAVLFMHEGVRTFAVLLRQHPEYPISDFFMDIAVRMPALTHLNLSFTFPVRDIEHDLIKLICSLTKLRKVVFPLYTLTSRVVEALSKLPQLGTIQFEFLPEQGRGDELDIEKFKPMLEDGAFPALWDLSLSTHLPDMTKFISGPFAPTNLTTLYVHALSAAAPAAVSDFLVAVSENCQLLECLFLELIITGTTPELEALQRAEQWLTFDALRPVLSCHRLIAFELRWAFPLQITYDEIEELASKWPFLEVLDLNCEPVPPAPLVPSPLTLRALLPFARHCPNLRELGLYLTATSVDLDLGLAADGALPQFRSLAQLRTGLSSIAEPGPVALFLSALCPPGCEVVAGVTCPEGFDVHEMDEDAGVIAAMEARMNDGFARWQEVARVLPLLIRLRAEERARRRSLEREVQDLRVRCEILEERATLKMAGDDSCTIL